MIAIVLTVPNVCDSIVIALFIALLAFEIRVTAPDVVPVPEVVTVKTLELATVVGVKTSSTPSAVLAVPEVKSRDIDKPDIVEFRAVPPSTSILISSLFILPSPDIDPLYKIEVVGKSSSCKSSPSVDTAPL